MEKDKCARDPPNAKSAAGTDRLLENPSHATSTVEFCSGQEAKDMDSLVCSLESNVSQPPEVESALPHNLNSASQSHDKGTAVPSFFKITSK